jgi:DNA-binding transcriptional MerR regulator
VSAAYLRIGELSRRTGVSPELLRAWERRYGLFAPERSPGRFRLYSDDDVARVEGMRSQIANGLSAAEAARRVLDSSPSRDAATPVGPALDEVKRALFESLMSFDDTSAHAAFDRLVASVSLQALLDDSVLPLLRRIGDGTATGEITIAQEHFASNLLRGRLMALGRGWGRGTGRHALLAAPAGEHHDLGLVALALLLRDRGWRVTFLGANTPIATITDASRRLSPEVVVLTMLEPVELPVTDVAELARGPRVLLSGAGASAEQARALGVDYFADGPIEAAELLASTPHART